MGILGLVRLIAKVFGKPSDLIAFIIAIVAGYFAASFLPAGTWTDYVFMLVSYHIFLAWMVVDSDKRSGLTLPIISTIFNHAAFVVIVVAVASIALKIPFVAIVVLICCGVVLLARYERDWLFRAGKTRALPVSKQDAEKNAAEVAITANVTADEYEEWLRYLERPNRSPRKPGTTVEDEYKQWLLARARATVAPTRQ